MDISSKLLHLFLCWALEAGMEQAMAHELIGIHDNRIDMSNLPGYTNVPNYIARVIVLRSWLQDDAAEVVLSADQDAFFEANMHCNFGELGENVKAICDELQVCCNPLYTMWSKGWICRECKAVQSRQRALRTCTIWYRTCQKSGRGTLPHYALNRQYCSVVLMPDLIWFPNMCRWYMSSSDNVTPAFCWRRHKWSKI